MNRRERRAAAAQGKTEKLDRAVAIHEAGHAVARVLVAPAFGMPEEQMIAYIDVSMADKLEDSVFDKTMKLISQATTYGPTLSAELQAVFDRMVEGMKQSSFTKKHIVEALALARADGIDVDSWLRARMLITTLASAAEAKHTARPVIEVWNSHASEGDRKGAVEDGVYAGATNNVIAAFIDEALHQSAALVEQENVWRAILALADALPDHGRVLGRRAVWTIKRGLT